MGQTIPEGIHIKKREGKLMLFTAPEAMCAKLASKEKIEKLMQDDQYIAQIKIDGFRMLAEKRDGKVRLFGRGSGKYASRTDYTDLLPHIVCALENVDGMSGVDIPNGTILDGEIAFLNDDGGADYIKTSNVMGSNADRAVKLQQERGLLTYQVFDILEYGNTPLINEKFSTRNMMMNGVVQRLHYPHIIPVQTIYGTDAKRELLANELGAGREGIMLKHLDSTYLPGKRRENTWYKVKAEKDADVVIIGYTEPDEFTQIICNGKKVVDYVGNPMMAPNRYFNNGWIGSLTIGQYVPENQLSVRQRKYIEANVEASPIEVDGVLHHLVPVGHVSSGLADELRAAISESRGRYLMRPIEIKYFKCTDDSYYLPRFHRFRVDKLTMACIWGE
jgi:ATP-dependent DNA ligase